MNRKGQVFDNLATLGIGIVSLAIILVVTFLIMAEAKDQAITQIDATTLTNVTKTITNGTTTALGDCITDEAVTVTTLYNDTITGTVLAAGNYTISSNIITLNVLGSGEAASKNITYSCKNPSSAYNGTGVLQNATGDIPGWIPIVVITAIGSILIGLVSVFRR